MEGRASFASSGEWSGFASPILQRLKRALVMLRAFSSQALRASPAVMRAGALALMSVLPVAADAAAYACVGKVDQVTVDPGGTVNASFAFGNGTMAWQVICSIDTGINSVPPAACKGILAVLMTARSSGQSVQMWFDNSTGGSCNAVPWQSIRNAGWYWGPSLQP